MRIIENISYEKKDLMHFLAKKGQITSEIYINQVFWLLAIFFYEKCFGEIEKMIYINIGAAYYTSKFIKKFYTKLGLLYIIWPVQCLDCNSIKNL